MSTWVALQKHIMEKRNAIQEQICNEGGYGQDSSH